MSDEKQFMKLPTTFSPSSERSKPPHQYAALRAKLLFGCYRRGDANDADTYVSAITAVLSRYDTDLIREVTDPNTGIQTTEKFATYMPNAGELKVYCESVAARRGRMRRYGDMNKPNFVQAALIEFAFQPQAGDLARVFVPQDHARYPKLVELTKTENPRFWKFGVSTDNRVGIWIAQNIWVGDKIDETLQDMRVLRPSPS